MLRNWVLYYLLFLTQSVHMLALGHFNTLTVVDELPFGWSLRSPESADTDEPETVLLAKSDKLSESAAELAAGLKIGQDIRVFVTTDERGEPYATLETPKVTLGQSAVLMAKDGTKFGAFFDWGLQKDLLVPSAMQETPINPGMRYLVHVYQDEQTDRILGATKLFRFYPEQSPYIKQGQKVAGTVYARTELGFKVLIENSCLGLIFNSDAITKLKVGQTFDFYVKEVREDGKVTLTLQQVNKAGRQQLEQAILDDLAAHGGFSTITDKSPPEAIFEHFKVSKNAYKKALGALYKQRMIVIEDDVVKLK